MKKKERLYLAAPLFNYSELTFNKKIKQILLDYFDVYLPQEDGGMLTDLINAGISPLQASYMIYKKDIDELNKCNLLLIILDGRTIDEGAAFELGFMKALRKPCFGFQTDSRRLHNNMNNPMIDCSLNATFYNSNDLFKWAADYNNSKTCSIQFTEK